MQAETSRIDVRQSRRSIQFRLFEARLGSLEEVVEVWTQPGEAMKPAQSDLVVALRTVCFSAGRRAVLVRQDPESGVSAAVWDGEQVSILSETELKRRSIPTAWFNRDCWTLQVFGSDSKKIRVDETHEFNRYAVTCPVPLEVDGRNLNHFGVGDVSRQRSSLLFITHPLRSRDLPKREGIRLARDAEEDKRARLVWILYQNETKRPSCLSWIRGGVVVEEEEFNLNAGTLSLRLFLSAEGLDTDLSTLSPRFPSPAIRKEWTRLAFTEVRDELVANTSTARQLPQTLGARTARTWHSDAIAIVAGVIGLPLTKGASALAAAGYLIRRESLESEKTAREGKAQLERLVEAVEFQRRAFH